MSHESQPGGCTLGEPGKRCTMLRRKCSRERSVVGLFEFDISHALKLACWEVIDLAMVSFAHRVVGSVLGVKREIYAITVVSSLVDYNCANLRSVEKKTRGTGERWREIVLMKKIVFHQLTNLVSTRIPSAARIIGDTIRV